MDVDLLRFVVVGSVDDGKSTLIGRLLYEAQALHDDHLSQVKRADRKLEESDELITAIEVHMVEAANRSSAALVSSLHLLLAVTREKHSVAYKAFIFMGIPPSVAVARPQKRRWPRWRWWQRRARWPASHRPRNRERGSERAAGWCLPTTRRLPMPRLPPITNA